MTQSVDAAKAEPRSFAERPDRRVRNGAHNRLNLQGLPTEQAQEP